jgi:hypothetical protein
MVGSSAGGHLAATVLAYNDKGDVSATDPVEKMRYIKGRKMHLLRLSLAALLFSLLSPSLNISISMQLPP